MAGYFISGFYIGLKNRGKRVTWVIESLEGKRLEGGTCDAELAHVQILDALQTVQQPGYTKNWKSGAQDGSLR